MHIIINDLRTHLPYARRFARALCGSQESGDAYILQTLEALVADRTILDNYDSSQKALYATFLRLWSSIAVNQAQDAALLDPDLASADKNLQAMSPRSRQAFLLVSMESFSTVDAAEILGVDLPAVSALIDEAALDIANQISTDVLIIEDEPLVAMDLEAAMHEIGHRILGIASTHREALELVKNRRPGLVLADIQLADGSSGIDAVNEMLTSFQAPIIFITAFPERLLTGEKPEPTFLITKPFDPNLVKAIASQALFFDKKASSKGVAA